MRDGVLCRSKDLASSWKGAVYRWPRCGRSCGEGRTDRSERWGLAVRLVQAALAARWHKDVV